MNYLYKLDTDSETDSTAPGQVPESADVTTPARTATFVDTSVTNDDKTRVKSGKVRPGSSVKAGAEEPVEQAEVPFPMATATSRDADGEAGASDQ